MFAFRLDWDTAILSQFSICKLLVFPFIHCLFVGLPVRATPNQEISSIYVQEDKMADGTPRRLCVSHSPLNGADFCGEGTGHFRSSGELTRKSIWNEHKIIAWSCWPYFYAEWLSKYQYSMNAISDWNKTESLIYFESLKGKRKLLLYNIIWNLKSWPCHVMSVERQYFFGIFSHVILSRYNLGSRGIELRGALQNSQLKIMPIASCFKRPTCLFFFITVEVTIQLRLKSAQSADQWTPIMGVLFINNFALGKQGWRSGESTRRQSSKSQKVS